MIKGSFWILLFYFIGEILSHLIGGFLPGSVIGMILLFAALSAGWLSPESVREVATAITKNMALFFVPVGVGLMSYFGLLARFGAGILTAISLSTILVIVVVALTQEFFEHRRKTSAPDDQDKPQE